MRLHPEYKNLLQFEHFTQNREINHFSTTRVGGVSQGEFASFNLGNFSDDDPVLIMENRKTLAQMFFKDSTDFIIPHQTHGDKVLVIDNDFLSLGLADKIETLYGVDATITAEKNIFLCATTADCVPILLFDKKRKIIAAIHAGWRGTVARIVAKTIDEMGRFYQTEPHDIVAGIGPSIGIKNFEVGEEVVAEFQHNGFDLTNAEIAYRSRSPLPGKMHLNLSEINRRELVRLGIPASQIETSDYCTFDNPEMFFSARRQTVHSGRMLTGIMLVSH